MRVMLALLFLLGVCSTYVCRAADGLPTAADIEARTAAASGPKPSNYRETIVGLGTLGNTKRVTYYLGDDVRNSTERNGRRIDSGKFRGESWNGHANGLTTVDAEDPGKEAQEPIVTTVARVAKPVEAYLISKLNSSGAGTRAYYDPATFHLIRAERVNAAGTEITSIEDFAQFGLRTLAKHWSVSSPAAHLEMRYERTEYAAGEVTLDDVQEPSSGRTLVEFPPGVKSVDLPAHTVRDAIYVRVGIGSKEGDFELDTGSSVIFIDTAFAKAAGLVLGDASSGVAAQRFTSYDAKVPELRIGALRMHDISVSVGPMPDESGSTVHPVGLLGFDFLAQLGVTIDYQNEIVRVVPAQDYVRPEAPHTAVFPIRIGDGVPMVTMSVTNAVADRMIVDTGCSCQIDFFDYFTRRYPNAFKDDVGAVQGFGVGGRVYGEMFRMPDVELGPAHFTRLLAFRVGASNFLYNADGLIGNQLLNFFTIGLDYTNGQMFLTPNAFGQRGMIRRPGQK